jgi:hypothetical protein
MGAHVLYDCYLRCFNCQGGGYKKGNPPDLYGE